MMIEVLGRLRVRCRVAVLLFVMGVMSSSLTASDAVACDAYKTAAVSNELQIKDAWSPTAPPTVGVHAGYLTIVNHTNASRVMVSASSPLYEQIDLHRTTLTNGIASMQAVASLSIAPGEQITLAPGGLHLMLRRATGKRAIGDRFPVTLHFQNGDMQTVEMVVKPLGTATPETDHSMHQHHQQHSN